MCPRTDSRTRALTIRSQHSSSSCTPTVDTPLTMSWFAETARSWTESRPVEIFKGLLEAAFFRNPEPQPVSTWRMVLDPPMPYWVTVFSQTCRIISFLILLPIFLVGVLDFAGYAVFRTLGTSYQSHRIALPRPIEEKHQADK